MRWFLLFLLLAPPAFAQSIGGNATGIVPGANLSQGSVTATGTTRSLSLWLSGGTTDSTSFCLGGSSCGAMTGSGNDNTAIGSGALQNNTLGQNTAFGNQACNQSNVHAITCFGNSAGASVTTGGDTIAIGNDAMNNDDASGSVTGQNNTAVGVHSLGHLTTGVQNVAVGNEAMVGCGTWSGQPSVGCLLTGGSNTAIGQNSLNNIQGTAAENTALGASAGTAITTGAENILIGSSAGSNLTTGSLNIMVGRDIRGASATGSNQLNIGNLIQGSGIQQGGAAANGEVDIFGKLTATAGIFPGGLSGAYLLANGANEFDFLNTNGGRMAVINTSSTGSGTSMYPTFSAGGGSNAGIAAINTVGGFGNLQLGNPAGGVSVLSPLVLKSYTVSTLPTCNSGIVGGIAYVTDATSPTYNATLSGSGAVVTMAFCNGSNWTAH